MGSVQPVLLTVLKAELSRSRWAEVASDLLELLSYKHWSAKLPRIDLISAAGEVPLVISRGVLSWESRAAGVCTKTGLPLAICENFHRYACGADSGQRSDLVPPCSYCGRPHELSV